MSEIRILWADDEIDLLKPQIIFLEQKGYAVEPVSNGHDALDKCKTEHFDLIFPGRTHARNFRIGNFIQDKSHQ
jgi:CheY-like chemotaxis protein